MLRSPSLTAQMTCRDAYSFSWCRWSPWCIWFWNNWCNWINWGCPIFRANGTCRTCWCCGGGCPGNTGATGSAGPRSWLPGATGAGGMSCPTGLTGPAEPRDLQELPQLRVSIFLSSNYKHVRCPSLTWDINPNLKWNIGIHFFQCCCLLDLFCFFFPGWLTCMMKVRWWKVVRSWRSHPNGCAWCFKWVYLFHTEFHDLISFTICTVSLVQVQVVYSLITIITKEVQMT